MPPPWNAITRIIIICLLLCLLTACSSPSPNQSTFTHVTPTPARSGGEPVLPYSQIHFQDAPLPTANDLRFDNGDWTLAGHDSASTRSVVLSSCCNTKAPAPLWYHSLGTPLLYAPVVGNGRVYLLGSDGYLHVLNAQTGEEQWRVSVGGELTSNGLALAHGRIYLALAGHFIAALDANTGQEQWRFDTGGVVRGAPLVVGRELLVASGPNSLWCIDALTGAKYWVFHSEDTLAQFWPTRTTPAVGDGKVYVALGASNEFNALSLQTGRKMWEVALDERMIGGPLLDEASGLVYLVMWSGRVVALDAHTGAIRWDVHLPGGSESSPALSQRLNMLYIGGFNGSFYALDASTGKPNWRISLGSAITASPLVVQIGEQNWVVLASQSGPCQVVDANTGKQLYTWKLGELRADPIVAQGVLYQASLGDSGLFAFTL